MHEEEEETPEIKRYGATEDDLPMSAGTDPAPAGVDGNLDVKPQSGGGYAGRDPKTEMPIVPSVPETHDDPKTHDALPDDKERPPNQ